MLPWRWSKTKAMIIEWLFTFRYQSDGTVAKVLDSEGST